MCGGWGAFRLVSVITPGSPLSPALSPASGGKGDLNRASAGMERVQVKPRAGRDSGPSRGFPLFQRRVHPLLEAVHSEACVRFDRCVADPSVAAILGVRAGSVGPLHRDDRSGSATVVCVQVKPRTGRASGLGRGFPLFQRRVHPLLGAVHSEACVRFDRCVADPSVAAILGVPAGSVGPLHRDDTARVGRCAPGFNSSRKPCRRAVPGRPASGPRGARRAHRRRASPKPR